MASCSSDLTVKLWTPHNNNQTLIGQHRDYVKCLASPNGVNSNYLLSGGLDRQIICWDLAENRGEHFSVKVKVDESMDETKGSVYALATNKSVSDNFIFAAGGPDSVIRLYDSRSHDSPIMKFVGHTDNIRSLLISDNGEWVLSGSSDSTIKLWSTTASRLLHTFDMHDDSIWSMFSTHPTLDVFYSADRSGLVVKTDLRSCGDKFELDENNGVCTALFNENGGVSKVVACGDYLWTTTSNSCIHRWQNFDTTPYSTKLALNSKKLGNADFDFSSPSPQNELDSEATNTPAEPNEKKSGDDEKKTTNVSVPFIKLIGGACVDFVDRSKLPVDFDESKVTIEPQFQNPVETLEGHIGIIKHRLLTDRRRVLTLDTAGEVKLWDLIQCIPLQSFGTDHDIDTLADEMNMFNPTSGSIANWCQVTTRTGEVYISLEGATCFDAEIYADELADDLLKDIKFKDDHRINLGKWVIRNLLTNLIDTELDSDKEFRKQKKRREKHPNDSSNSISSLTSGSIVANDDDVNNNEVIKSVPVPDSSPAQPAAAAPAAQTSSKKFRLRFGKSKKDKEKSSSPAATATTGGAGSASTTPAPPVVERPEMSLNEVIEELRKKYEGRRATTYSVLNPPSLEDAPPINIPHSIKFMISDLSPNSGGTVDLYRGTVGTVGSDVDLVEALFPEWIARAILSNEIPVKESVKIGFLLQPYSPIRGSTALPTLPAAQTVEPVANGAPPQGTVRLTAYHMLRARKVMDYLVDKFDKNLIPDGPPETWLELLCQDKVLTPTMTLSTIRTRIWRSGGDVVIKYRKKEPEKQN